MMKKERRQRTRMPLRVEAAFSSVSDDVSNEKLENIGDGGAFFTPDQPPKKGDVIKIRAGTSLASVGSVIHVRRLDDDRFGFGVRFFRFEDDSGSEE